MACLAATGALFAAETSGERIEREAAAADEWVVQLRRDFHQHPELSNREQRTAMIVAKTLRELGFDIVQTNIAKHGVVGSLRGKLAGPVMAIRADMDGLPIQEPAGLPFASQNAGVMHACGHDAHTAIGLGVARILSRMRDQLPGEVKMIFQPAEEGAPAGEKGGANVMVAEGVLENPRPAAILGLHVMPTIEVGNIAYRTGGTMASSDRFFVRIHGRKTHGAYPHDGVDAIVMASQYINALQTIRSRRIDTLEPLIISVGKIEGGVRNNIVADLVTLEGTVRTHNETVRKQAVGLMKKLLDGICAANDGTGELEYTEGAPVTFNDPKLAERLRPMLLAAVGESHVLEAKPQMGAEDFAFYQQVIPGFFYFLGVANKDQGITSMIHTPDFKIDERALGIGIRVMSKLAVGYLEKKD